MKTLQMNPIFTVLFSGFLLSACNVNPGAMIGEDRAADDSAYGSGYGNSVPCDKFYTNTKDGTGDCSMPYIAGTLSETDGDNGNVVYYLKQLSDGNYPVVQTLKFEATEKVSIGGSESSVNYDIVFNCTAGTDTPEHLRPFHCVAQAAPRLRSTAQPGGGTVKFRTMTVENPSCHSTVTYEFYTASCYPGADIRPDIKSPTLGLVKQ